MRFDSKLKSKTAEESIVVAFLFGSGYVMLLRKTLLLQLVALNTRQSFELFSPLAERQNLRPHKRDSHPLSLFVDQQATSGNSLTCASGETGCGYQSLFSQA